MAARAFLYEQAAARLRQAIRTGSYAPGQRLPDERRLALEQRISRPTLRLALAALERDGLIERIQGRGSYVATSLRRGRYLCLLGSGPDARSNHYLSLVIAQAERAATEVGLRLSVRYIPEQSDLRAAMRQVEQDATVLGGLLVGRVAADDVVPTGRGKPFPWVMIGDYADPERRPTAIDQVVGDTHALVSAATRHLVAVGVRHAALFVFDSTKLWSRDTIDAFRAVLDEAGVPPSRQEVHDLWEASIEDLAPAASFDRRCGMVGALIDRWARSGNWPAGLILGFEELGVLDACLRARPAASRWMANLHIGVPDFEEADRQASGLARHRRVAWALVSIAEMTRLAVSSLMAERDAGAPPRRHYLRTVRVIAAAPRPALRRRGRPHLDRSGKRDRSGTCSP